MEGNALCNTHYHHGVNSPYGYGHQGYAGNAYGTDLDTLILANQIASGHQQIGDKIHTASINGIKETSDAARDTVDAIRDSVDATNQIGNINLQATERNGGETRSSVERTAGETRDTINFSANQSARDFAGISRDLCNTRKEMSDGFALTNLEACKAHADIKLEMCKQHGELARQIDARAAEAAKALAECCCDLKQEHSATRQLLQSQTLDECRRRESDLTNQVNLLKILAGQSGGGNGPGPFGS